MKIQKCIYLFVVLQIIFVSCNKNQISDDLLKLSGTVYQEGKTSENVLVELQGKNNLTTNTNSDGYFEFENIKKGDYNVFFRQNNTNLNSSDLSADTSEAFVEKSMNISLMESTNLNEIILPKPVTLYVDYNESKKTAVISWNQTDAEDFREYKLYSNYTSGLDENSGTLVHVSSSISDTSYFVDYNKITAKNFYYRVYVMNEFARLGGSNIENVNTETVYSLSSYTLNLKRSIGIPIEHPTGIASDQSNLWIIGSEYASSKAKLICYDLTSYNIIKEFNLDNLYSTRGTGVFGITWDGTNIWISIAGNTNKIVKVDTVTGLILKQWTGPIRIGLCDLDWNNGSIWIADGWEVYKMDPVSGGSELVFKHARNVRGIAIRENEIWVGGAYDKEVNIYDKNTGKHLGLIENSINDYGFCFHNGQLITLNSSGIHFYDILDTGE